MRLEKGDDRAVRKKLGDRLFPPRYDFNGMLENQANETVNGVRELVDWLKQGANLPLDKIAASEQRADQIRHEMEQLLQDAFSTPFDRQDIYSVSRQMDQVLNFSYSTAVEMTAFKVAPDPAIHRMAQSLLEGVIVLASGVHMMHHTVRDAQGMIRQIRKHAHEIEDTYIESIALLFLQDDAIMAIKKREIYHHLRDAGRSLNSTVDILHRIIMALA
jgi:uncharacterized protein Yka (UPF0111/DUF47 family)